jgi:hypothetical protein
MSLLEVSDGDGGSGVFPADSVSNTDSRSESWLRLIGAGGSGLLRSVCDGVDEIGLELDRCNVEPTWEGDTILDELDGGSSLNSSLINLPCLELGGGGFIRLLGVEPWDSDTNPRLSSSRSDISCDVQGDSTRIS